MSTRFYDQQFAGILPPPKPVPGDGAGLDRPGEAEPAYRLSEVDLSLSHGKAVTRVGIDYTIEDGDGIGEVGYLYPINTLVLVAPNRALPVQVLPPGMVFLL